LLQAPFVAPAGPVEEAVADIWRDILQVDRVGARDNFFSLGGDSLLAVQLFVRIQKVFGRALPLSTLFKAPTIRQLAAVLQERPGSGGRPPAIEILSRSRGRPLFFVHTLSGELLCWRPLIKYLGQDHTIYGLKLPEENGVGQPFNDIPAMAAHHVEQMCLVQPEGSFCVVGYCFGASLALEIAQQLVSRGREVGLLAVIDAAPSRTQARPNSVLRTIYQAVLNLRYWVSDDLLATRPDVKLARVYRKVTTILRRVGGCISPAPPAPSSLPDSYRKKMQTHHLAWSSYAARPYAGSVAVFKARTRPLLQSFDPNLGWRQWVEGQTVLLRWWLLSLDPDLGWGGMARGGAKVCEMPGHHWDILQEPYVQHLAQEMRLSLAHLSGPYKAQG
jgi:thioesterase domain-containing protein/acyl carrier protein